MELGLQLFSVRNSLQKDVKATLQEIARIGYRNIEFANHEADKHPGCGFPMEAKELRLLLESLGLKAVSCHVHPMTRDTISQVLDYQLEMGNRNLVFGMPFYRSADDALRQAEQMNEIAAIAHTRGVVTFYHNHFHEFQKFGDRYVLDILMDNTDPATVGMQLDTYWALRGGQNPVEWINKLGARCGMIHQKDLPGGVSPVNIFDTLPEDPAITMESFFPFFTADNFTEPGSGVMDIPGIIRAAEVNHAQYIIVEQDMSRLPELESVRVSYEAIQRLLGK